MTGSRLRVSTNIDDEGRNLELDFIGKSNKFVGIT